MNEAKPVLTPLPTSPILQSKSGSPLNDPTEYRKVVGSLQYLLLTRPDIAFAVNKLSQYMHSPTTEHWLFVKRLLRYLCGSINDGLQLHRHSPLQWIEQATEPSQEVVFKALLGARRTMSDTTVHKVEDVVHLCRKEPESQAQLLDATMSMEGVLLAGVPGAGGFDAVIAIMEDPHSVSLETGDPGTRKSHQLFRQFIFVIS
ncbi:hypothetical protein DKX38_001018 [Salix brachista]|uniref:Uncharacterized protein n=1 Tax=Salix brachista TaxID=2182728 RepID=A0A5N5P228_9ROSI|nr:hypothetical protein DKX38_001018 [Salix brachista]